MKQIFLLTVFKITFYLCINKLFYFLNRKRQLLLTYHNVIKDRDFDDALHLGVSHRESVFKYQLEYLEKKFSFSTLIGEEKSCVLSFDDGYSNNYSVVHCLLKVKSIKGFFFIPTIIIKDRKNTLTIDLIMFWFSYVPVGKYLIFDRSFFLDDTNRLDVFSNIWKFITDKYILVNSISEHLNSAYPFDKIEYSYKKYQNRFYGLSTEEIVEMKRFGHKIGAHSGRHDILSKLTPDDLNRDILGCEKLLTEVFNTSIFSYPYGGKIEVSERVIKRVENSKFSLAFTNISEPHFKASRYTIPRFTLPNTKNKYIIDAKLSGLEHFLKFLKLRPSVKGYL
jgi:peptidoglycan/xylan/chitin deacetylase (PgdA/CDA1 family)